MKLRPYLILRTCRIHLTIILIPSLVLLSSCAILYNGSNQLIPVGSSPQVAKVYVDGERVGTTPLELARASSHTLLLRWGDLERKIIITNTLNGGMVALGIAPGATFLTLLLWLAHAVIHKDLLASQLRP
jgi:tetrahydromethanopterin S-methyltransferase subunit D